MNLRIASRIKSMVVALMLPLLFGVALSAQAQTGRTISVDLVNLRHQSLGSGGTQSLNSMIDTIWQEMIPGEQEDVKKDIDPMVKGAIGRGTRNETCNLNSHGVPDLQVLSPTSFKLKYFVSGNKVDFYVTLPGPQGKWADPEFSVDFDLTLDIPIYLTINGLEARGATATPGNARVDSQNVPADLVKDFDGLARFIAGKGIFDVMERKVNAKGRDITDKINASLKGLNDKLADYVRKGYQHLQGLLEDAGSLLPRNFPGTRISGQVLRIAVSRPSYRVPTGNATVSGTVRWDKSSGLPKPTDRLMSPIASSCDLLKVVPIVVLDDTPYPPGVAIGADSHVQVGRLRAFEFVDNGSQYECRYTVDGLPHDVPVHFHIDTKANAKWSGVAAGTITSFAPVGWSGDITLRPRKALDLKNTTTQVNQSGSPQAPILPHGRIEGTGGNAANATQTTSPQSASSPAAAIGRVSQATQAPANPPTKPAGNWMNQTLQRARQAAQPAPVQPPAPSAQKPPTPIEKAMQVAEEMQQAAAGLLPAIVTGRDFLMVVTMRPHW